MQPGKKKKAYRASTLLPQQHSIKPPNKEYLTPSEQLEITSATHSFLSHTQFLSTGNYLCFMIIFVPRDLVGLQQMFYKDLF